MQRCRMRNQLAALAGAIIALGGARSGNASSIGVNPTADASVSAANPNSNFGKAGAVEISNPNATKTGTSAGPKGQFQTVVRFDLSSVKSSFDSTYGTNNWTVQSVVLQLTCSNPSNNSIFNDNSTGQLFFSLMNGATANNWIEGTGTPQSLTPPGDGSITFNNLANYTSGSDVALGSFGYTAANSGNVTYNFGLPAALVSEVTSGSTANLRLISTTDPTESSLFNSRDFAGGSNPSATFPLLTVTAVPEPATISFATAATVLLLIRRRRHA